MIHERLVLAAVALVMAVVFGLAAKRLDLLGQKNKVRLRPLVMRNPTLIQRHRPNAGAVSVVNLTTEKSSHRPYASGEGRGCNTL